MKEILIELEDALGEWKPSIRSYPDLAHYLHVDSDSELHAALKSEAVRDLAIYYPQLQVSFRARMIAAFRHYRRFE